jgi:hypothetical protein
MSSRAPAPGEVTSVLVFLAFACAERRDAVVWVYAALIAALRALSAEPEPTTAVPAVCTS